MANLADAASFAIDLRKLSAAKRAAAFWIDPGTGKSAAIGEFPTIQPQRFTTPAGWQDALLIVEPAKG